MTRFILAAGVAALAITSPAAAGPHGGGGGHGNGGGHAEQARGGGGGGGHGQQARQARGGGQQARQAQARQSRGGGERARMAQAREQRGGGQRARMAQAREQRGGGQHARQAQAREQRGRQMHEMQAQRARANERANVRTAERIRANQRNVRQEMARRNEALGRNNGPVIAARENQRMALRDRGERVNFAQNLGYGIGGCPPGLAKKPVACMPPGQAKQLVGTPLSRAARVASLNELPVRLQSLYSPTPDYYYRYGDGYLYRVNRSDDVISSLLPLFGAGYMVGQPFPSSYPYYAMPAAYQPFYPSSPYSDYRYADGYMYQVDPYTGLIENVDPLLGYGYGYGQPMPLAYSAYNVPYQYRPYYYDTSDYYYRYAPGAIYQVDPTTSLITAVAALLSPNSLAIGQPLPVGYSAYNVPYAYRSTYYDTPDAWYRYSNGNIYRVDPATQLVTALVVSALT